MMSGRILIKSDQYGIGCLFIHQEHNKTKNAKQILPSKVFCRQKIQLASPSGHKSTGLVKVFQRTICFIPVKTRAAT